MVSIRSKNQVTLPIEPQYIGGQTKQVTIHRGQVAPLPKKAGRKKAPQPTAYLLIGYDTEFQTIDAIQRSDLENKPQNEVLSYQFSVKLITKEGRDNPPIQTDGIIVPQDGERYSIDQFLAFAIGSFLDAYPDIIVPVDVYLIGHFLRADFPAFEEFTNIARHMTSNVRNTFVSVDRHTPLHIKDDRDEPVGTFRVRIRDTMLLSPANAKRLEDIGEIVGLPKISLANDPADELKIKQNMADFLKRDWPAFRRYAIRDAEVCVRYAEQLIDQSTDLFDAFQLPITLTSFGTKLVLEKWDQAGWDRDHVLGRETVHTKVFDSRLGYFIKETKHPFTDLVEPDIGFATDSFHGGRNEQFIFGAAPTGDWRDVDLSSAYTTAMSLIGFPQWDQIRVFKEIDDIEITDLAFFLVDFEFPDTVRYPTMPVRTNNGIIFPRCGRAYCGAPEYLLAKKLGAELTTARSVIVPTDRNNSIFKTFIQDAIQKRSEHDKGTFHNMFWKEVGNSTYGKTAQGLRKRRVYDLRTDDMVDLPESPITQPFFAAFITSFTRAVLGEIINALPQSSSVFSVTTDGFLTNADLHSIEKALTGPITTTFSQARFDLVGSNDPVEIKHQIRRPIGWRTRGSATLEPGLGKDKIVLQKGGIKTNQLLDLNQQNSHIIRLFLDRYPGQVIDYTIGLGIKDMIRFEADFVSRAVNKRLGMEFDWKRRPINPTDQTFTFEGQTYTHLSFESEPLESISEFTTVRDAWERFNSKKQYRCLKTRADFDQFQAYLETQKLPENVSRYLRKDDADGLVRLRRDLTRAFKHETAGFDRILARTGKISHKTFCEILISSRVECKVSDIDNAKRYPFKPNQVVPTEAVISILNDLKTNHFPELEIEHLLASSEGVDATQPDRNQFSCVPIRLEAAE